MVIHRTFAFLAILYILSILTLPWLIPERMMNHLWNPYSLLHIPLYGILMVLLRLTLLPLLMNSKLHPKGVSSFILPGGIAFLTGLLDEVNQMFIPGRYASMTDLFLNAVGIGLASVGIYFFQKRLTNHQN